MQSVALALSPQRTERRSVSSSWRKRCGQEGVKKFDVVVRFIETLRQARPSYTALAQMFASCRLLD